MAPTADAEVLLGERFPTELLAAIVGYCDVQTLGRLGRVSSSCLSLSSTLLYEDITLTDELSMALLLRIPHPDGSWANDATGEILPVSTGVVSSARVLACTARSLIHSITYTGATTTGDRPFAYLDEVSCALPKLDLPVLVISVPPPPQDIDRGRHHLLSSTISSIMALVNPVSFIALQREQDPLAPVVADASVACPAPAETRWPGLVLKNEASWDVFPMPWTRLKHVVMCGVRLYGFEGLIRPLAPPRTLVISVDLLAAPGSTNPHHELGDLLGSLIEGFDIDLEGRDPAAVGASDDALKVKAWVRDEAIKRVVETGEGSNYGATVRVLGDLGRRTFIEVAGDRRRAFRDELVQYGVRRNMDWDVLD